MKKRMQTGNDGFTLIEVILSIAILALISVPLIKYFTDSLGYSVKTQEKQNATMVAQETIEFLKSQEVLMKWQSATNSSGNTVMHYNITDALKEQFGVPLDQTIEQFDAAHPSPGYDRSSGKGLLSYSYGVAPDGYSSGYDILVNLETNVGATEIARPIVYGIDDTTNVVAAEYNEEEDALMQFMARNAAALVQQRGGYIIGVTPEPTGTSGPMYTVAPEGGGDPDDPVETATPSPFGEVEEQTEEMIKENLRRTIHVDLDMQEEILEGGTSTFYTVRVYYEYSCINISTTDPSNPDVVFSNDIINTNVKELEGIYIMFNKVHLTEDRIEFKWIGTGGTNPPEGQYPEIRLICQDLNVSATPAPGAGTPVPGATVAPAATTAPGGSDTYMPTIYLENFTGWNWQPEVRTNLESPSTFLLDDSSQISNKTLLVKKLTESGNPVRVFKIVVDVYKKGDLAEGKDPIVRMITSKTE